MSLCRDHPHAYGDKLQTLQAFQSVIGSSPRVWGQAACGLLRYACAGIIPTRMGTRSDQYCANVKNKDHPHAYGDKLFPDSTQNIKGGSSPRVWGQVFICSASYQLRRIIPTRMGTSKSDRQASGASRDHPHAYGDKHQKMTNDQTGKGSSPRVWGQDYLFIGAVKGVGIIPTRMGTSFDYLLKYCLNRDHPHAYGDKYWVDTRNTAIVGSSPRVWGQVVVVVDTPAVFGIIPTRMGTRTILNLNFADSEDHPHAYGDKPNLADFYNVLQGSSPRVWGQELLNCFIEK